LQAQLPTGGNIDINGDSDSSDDDVPLMDRAKARAAKWCGKNKKWRGETVEEYVKRVELIAFDAERMGIGRRGGSAVERRGRMLLGQGVRTVARAFYADQTGQPDLKPYKIIDHANFSEQGMHYHVTYYRPGYADERNPQWVATDQVNQWPGLLKTYHAVSKPRSTTFRCTLA